MNKAVVLGISGGMFALGAGVAYYFDTRSGKRRRATLRDKALHAARKMKTALSKAERDLANRAAGLMAEWRALGKSGPLDDRKLEGRIRARLGRLVSHPHSIHVELEHGVVTFKGLVLAEESERLLKTISAMEGVTEVHNELLTCKSPEHISGLQGGRPRQTGTWGVVGRHWPPAVRLGAIAAGGACFVYGIARKDELGLTLILLSTAAVLKGASDEIWGAQHHDAVQFEETIRIYAPLSDVFDFWADPRNYPRAMSHVVRVEKTGENLYHWTVSGPGGGSIGWDATIADKIPNTLLAWKSIEGSAVQNEGTVFLDPIYDGSTRLHVRMWYRIPGGLAGRIVAAALGADPAKIIRHDLHQFKLGMERAEHAKEAHKPPAA